MFLTSASIRRLVSELDPPLICFLGADKWRDKHVQSYESLRQAQEALKTGRIEGSCYDLHLDSIHVHAPSDEAVFLGRKTRRLPKTEPLPFLSQHRNFQSWILEPGRFYLLQSVETINMPPWLMGLVHMRTSIFRAGADTPCSFVKPGYRGRITVGMTLPQGIIEIQRHFKFCSVAFAGFYADDVLKNCYGYQAREIAGETDPYKGIWGSDRLTTEGKEERAY